jgi:periplasmic protein CpxP/Spy
MKTWIRRTLIGLFGTSVLLGGIAACSHGGGDHHGWRGMNGADAAQMQARLVDKAAAKLDLDAAQKARLTVLAERLRSQHQALTGGASDPRAEWTALIAGPAFDRAKAQALLTAKTEAVRQNGPAVLEALADFYDGLRPEQQQQLRDLMSRGHRGRRG